MIYDHSLALTEVTIVDSGQVPRKYTHLFIFLNFWVFSEMCMTYHTVISDKEELNVFLLLGDGYTLEGKGTKLFVFVVKL